MRRSKDDGEPRARKKVTMPLTQFMANEVAPLADIISFCNNIPMSLYADSTVIKSPEVVFRGQMFSRNRFLSEEFLLNFRRSEADFGIVVGTNNYTMPMAVGAMANRDTEEDEENFIPLPPFQNVRAPIGPVIRSRRSVRQYSGNPLSLQDLSTVLYHSAGVSGRLDLENPPDSVALEESDHIDLRTAVSGGGLYPVDLYVVALNIEHLANGTYRFNAKHHALVPVGKAEEIPALSSLGQFGDIQAEKSAFLLCYVYNLFENARKYGDMGMGFAFMEAGAIATQVHLIGTAMGFGSCDVGSYRKSRFEHLLKVDGISKHMIHLTVVGK
ncbi:MAG: sagB [Chthonomonadales bacterium]|nr:sagB [Chthonomonadales bacterium]